jgi:hypothetical protein
MNTRRRLWRIAQLTFADHHDRDSGVAGDPMTAGATGDKIDAPIKMPAAQVRAAG